MLATALPGAAANGSGQWPTRYRTASGHEFVFKGLYQYQFERAAGGTRGTVPGTPWLDDMAAWRRKELAFLARTPWGAELTLGYDFTVRHGVHPTGWIDNYLRHGSARFGEFRLGQFKTPVGWEEAMSSGATTFLERALPVQAINMGRRIGFDWSRAATPHWLLQAAWFAGGDLNGDNDGHGPAARVAWTPFGTAADASAARPLLHLGLAISRETRSASSDGRGVASAPTARVRARPETALNDARLVDTGRLALLGAIDRLGLEFACIDGPLLIQGEYLQVAVQPRGEPAFNGHGWYLQTAWLVTGESRPYAKGGVGNARPQREWGAVELALRYSTLDLDDGPVHGGRQHDWTLGANWYLGQHLKLQANYVRAHGERYYPAPIDRRVTLAPEILEARVQIQF